MYRLAARATLRSSQSSLAPAKTLQASRRCLTTEAPHLRSRSWKSATLRWGIAAGVIYYYNTSPVFAEYPQNNLLNPNLDALDDEKTHPTLDQITASSRNRAQKDASTLQSAIERSSESAAIQKHENETVNTQTPKSSSNPTSNRTPTPTPGNSSESTVSSDASDLSDQADSEGAFNPVTGEINWDCPCLGGMAYGPCGDEFRAAFSCFVYSSEEPKGMECIEKFSGMQECFRAHPEVYQGELEDDEDQNGEFAEEKEQLRNEIQERREAVEKKQSGSSQRNLLEEPESAETASAPKKTSKKSSSASSSSSSSPSSKKSSAPSQSPSPSSSSSSWDPPQKEAKTTSHTPFQFSADKEVEHGASSQVVRKPQNTGVDANAMPESESLVPKASHDAR